MDRMTWRIVIGRGMFCGDAGVTRFLHESRAYWWDNCHRQLYRHASAADALMSGCLLRSLLADVAKLQMRHQELTQATLDQSVDDEAVYYKVAGECPKGRFYDLESLGRKKRRYADPGASTSQVSPMVPRSEFDSVPEQLRQVVAFMQMQLGMTMDGAGLSQPPPPPPLPHEQQQT
ncbi:hypothetical protein Scep_014086 [Stephania cephalantha]|uniref:Uncharacterized protein n=1 Tax=Stephania cephalantha TaxID=152367 RepID=A0AAP0J1D1_9MAGN